MFVPILNTSISASWLILAIVVIRLVFKKMPKAWTCVLWGLVAIRLICPFSIESPLSVIPSAEVIPEEVLYMEGAQRHDPVEFNGIEAPTVQETVGEAVGETVSQVQIFDVKGSLMWLAGMAVMLLYARSAICGCGTGSWYLSMNGRTSGFVTRSTLRLFSACSVPAFICHPEWQRSRRPM